MNHKKNTKERLFYLMKKINNLNEIQDVKVMKQSLDKDVLERIDNPNEFKKAFMVWFNKLGFDPVENPISKGQVLRDVGDVLDDLLYR